MNNAISNRIKSRPFLVEDQEGNNSFKALEVGLFGVFSLLQVVLMLSDANFT